jgi:dienelactone hydrolase
VKAPFLIAGAVLLCVAAAESAQAAPRFAVTPTAALLDQRVGVRVSGLRALQEVLIRTTTPDAEGRAWRAEASLRANAKGVVDVDTEPALAGTYTGVDAMGLFWSARPDTSVAPPAGVAFPRPVSGLIETRLEAVAGGKTVASTTFGRYVTTDEVNVTEVGEDGLLGRLYEPSGIRHPAVLVLSDKSGGIPPTYASVLAAHGYVTFALASVPAEALSRDVAEAAVEHVRNGIEWLRARPSVDPARIAVLGIAKGAALALLVGTTEPQVKAVIGLSPSRDDDAASAAAIPVEKIGGPVLLVSIRGEGMPPTAVWSERVVERLRANGFAHAVEHLSYGDSSPALPDAWLPPAYGGTLGGTAEGTMRAYADYWPKLLSFLGRAVGPAPAGR